MNKRSFTGIGLFSLDFLTFLDLRVNYHIDPKELGADTLGSEWRNLRPRNCDCWGILSPEEEAWEWHVHHVKRCIGSYKELEEFEAKLRVVVEKEVVRFNKEKKKVWEIIKKKAEEIGYDQRLGDGKLERDMEFFVDGCLNSEKLEEMKKERLAVLEEYREIWLGKQGNQKDFKELQQQKLKQEQEEKQKLQEQLAMTRVLRK